MSELISSRSYLIPGNLEVSELWFKVPKDYTNPSSGSLFVFARSATKNSHSVATERQKPWYVWLHGGPGKGCLPPQKLPMTKFILQRGYRVLYLDQRGTGLSSPVSAETLSLQGTPQQQAHYLMLFRADNIVRDCEAIRKLLTHDCPASLQKWTIHGQSFGGFCVLTYLSLHPEGLLEAFITAGIPPIHCSPEEVYQATFPRMVERNKIYYQKYPEDVEAVHKLAVFLQSKGGVLMPAGGTLTFQRFLMLGMQFGLSGGIDTVHDIVLRMSSDLDQFNIITRATLTIIEAIGGYDDAIIYSILREAIYCNGTTSNWAAERVARLFEQFSWVSTLSSAIGKEKPEVPQAPLHFSGGMVIPHMFDTFGGLKGLKEVAEIIAKCQDWPTLYDQYQLARNEVPVYTASFVDDAFIDFELAQQVVKGVQNCKQFITNTLYHDGVRSSPSNVFEALWKLKDDTLD